MDQDTEQTMSDDGLMRIDYIPELADIRLGPTITELHQGTNLNPWYSTDHGPTPNLVETADHPFPFTHGHRGYLISRDDQPIEDDWAPGQPVECYPIEFDHRHGTYGGLHAIAVAIIDTPNRQTATVQSDPRGN
jgi:hypothetical protein